MNVYYMLVFWHVCMCMHVCACACCICVKCLYVLKMAQQNSTFLIVSLLSEFLEVS